jgi:hypothetical protein
VLKLLNIQNHLQHSAFADTSPVQVALTAETAPLALVWTAALEK